jgi:tetratricopeptide (TPR) repeat protein
MTVPDAVRVPIQGGAGTQVGSNNVQINSYGPSSHPPHEVAAPQGVHNLPAPSAVFVGRDLVQLERLLGDSRAGVVVGQVAVHGLGGIGKTELVIHFAHRYLSRYRLVWWITADNVDNIGQGLARLANRLQTGAAVTYGQEWAIGWLQSHPGWLLVLDNVEDIADIQPLLGQVAGRGDILVTTRRDPAASGWAPLGLAPLHLEPLNRAASIDLLIRLTANHDHEGADALAADLGDLPLALEQAAAYISRHRGMDFQSYRQAFASRFDKVSRHGGRGGNTERTVSQVWQVTMATITEQSSLARSVLDVMAWLAPDELPQDVLYPLGEDPDEVLDAVALLADHNMIKWQDHAVKVHRLVQAVTRTIQLKGDHTDLASAAQAVMLLNAAAPTGNPWTDVVDWPTWSGLLPHIDAVYLAMHSDRRDEVMLHLADRAASFRQGQGQLSKAITQFEQVLADRRRILGEDHPSVWNTRLSLAFAYQVAERVAEAINLYGQVLADQERVLGDVDPATMATRYYLATAYRVADRVTDAIVLFEKVLADQLRVLDVDHPDTLNTRRGLAIAYQAVGRVDEAIGYLEGVAADQQRVLGRRHLVTLSTGYDLGVAYLRAGRSTQAIELLEQVLDDQQEELGDDHQATLNTRHALAAGHQAEGRLRQAIALYESVLVDFRRVLGTDHQYTRLAEVNLQKARSLRSRSEENARLGRRDP